MRVSFYVEDQFFFRYIGCATAARTLYGALDGFEGLEIAWKRGTADADLVHYHTFGPLALHNRRRARGVTVLTAHSTPRINQGNIAFARRINRLYPRIYAGFDHIVTISEPCHREVAAMVPETPVTLIPNGVDRARFRPDPALGAAFREQHGIGDEERVVLSVAQMTPRKGIYDFFDLAARHPEIRFVWVGGLPTASSPRTTRGSPPSGSGQARTSSSPGTWTGSMPRTRRPTPSSWARTPRPSASSYWRPSPRASP